MGTPASPEGLPHWSTKTLMWHKLRRALMGEQYRYASPLPNEFRRVSVPAELSMPEEAREVLEGFSVRVNPIPNYSFVMYPEAPHDGCEGGPLLANILKGLEGGRVMQEAPFAGFTPDIALYPRDADRPSRIIEVVDTSFPREAKLDAMKRKGIEVYVLMANKENPLAILEEPVHCARAIAQQCGESQRREISDLSKEWQDSEKPFLGIRSYESGTQEYLFGEEDPYGDVEWVYGEPKVHALVKVGAPSPSAPIIRTDWERKISRDLFVLFLVVMKCVARPLLGHDSSANLFNSHIEDLLSMVRFPNK